ncbi:BolA family protein [endosymbiont of unidentified scaly snail isolate Monju]|uniref:BolA family protein n=1 Tax=endosymbiont of unidentified scaly snail isolate Monju TaxID=1248727 RepID=UPI000389246F|nr:BolA/IbaG family iron-sulfur metabolism protein [endosymbiont of unidentified scaly snail isolate Monju]BAN68547.1 BolA protein [endosymbiont of unidentified scaly snail isolate Monju]
MRMQERIEQALKDAFAPLHLEVLDESHMHNVPEDAQSHFKVTLVAEAFAGQSLIQRHRAVNQVLAGEIMDAIHALALHTMTPEEWFAKGGQLSDSPPCLGGGKS